VVEQMFLLHDAMLAQYMPCLCVCLSVTSRCSTEMANHMIQQTGTLVFWCRISRQISNGVTPSGGVKCKWGRL